MAIQPTEPTEPTLQDRLNAALLELSKAEAEREEQYHAKRDADTFLEQTLTQARLAREEAARLRAYVDIQEGHVYKTMLAMALTLVNIYDDLYIPAARARLAEAWNIYQTRCARVPVIEHRVRALRDMQRRYAV